jgi:hypothetical protein
MLCAFGPSVSATAQQAKSMDASYSRKNTFTVFAEYAKESTPIIAGTARQRRLGDVGVAYTRRVVRFLGGDLGYHVELRPVLFEGDPVTIVNGTTTYTSGPNAGNTFISYGSFVAIRCAPENIAGIVPGTADYQGFSYTTVETCGRQWTFGQSFAPFGFKYSLRTQHPVQPFLVGTLGYMFTSRPVPVPQAESLNFVINIGLGVEVYRAGKRSVAVEVRGQHFSNRDTAEENPGTDNLLLKVSYSFGR